MIETDIGFFVSLALIFISVLILALTDVVFGAILLLLGVKALYEAMKEMDNEL